MKKVISGIVFAIVLTACGSDNGGSSSTPSKTLFSMWTSEDNQTSFDLSGASFGSASTMQFLLTGGAICQCLITPNGDEAEGTLTVNNCTYQGGGSGDPNCSNALENNSTPYDYTKTGLILRLCFFNSSCENYD